MKRLAIILAVVLSAIGPATLGQEQPARPPSRLTGLKAQAADRVDAMRKLTQEIVGSLFSFAELGFQEFETQRYLTEILSATQETGLRVVCLPHFSGGHHV